MPKYLRVSDFKGYDDYYLELDDSDQTWDSVLDQVKSVLDEKFTDNGEKLVGITMQWEIVDKLPEDIEWE